MNAIERCDRRTVELKASARGDVERHSAWCFGDFGVVLARGVWGIISLPVQQYVAGVFVFPDLADACAALVEIDERKIDGRNATGMTKIDHTAVEDIVHRHSGISVALANDLGDEYTRRYMPILKRVVEARANG